MCRRFRFNTFHCIHNGNGSVPVSHAAKSPRNCGQGSRHGLMGWGELIDWAVGASIARTPHGSTRDTEHGTAAMVTSAACCQLLRLLESWSTSVRVPVRLSLLATAGLFEQASLLVAVRLHPHSHTQSYHHITGRCDIDNDSSIQLL